MACGADMLPIAGLAILALLHLLIRTHLQEDVEKDDDTDRIFDQL